MASRLGVEFRNWFCFHQFPWLIQVIIDDGLWVDANAVIDGREELGRVNGILKGGRTCFVGFTVDIPTFDTCSAYDGCITVGPVIATISAVAIARG